MGPISNESHSQHAYSLSDNVRQSLIQYMQSRISSFSILNFKIEYCSLNKKGVHREEEVFLLKNTMIKGMNMVFFADFSVFSVLGGGG